MAAGLVLTAAQTAPVYCRLASSARMVRQHLREFERSGQDLSPAERLMFSLLLAKTGKPR
jgi:hypothetical protein